MYFILSPFLRVKKTLNICDFFCLGPWRWYDETMLDCCEPLNKIKNEGISLRNVTCLARCAGAKVVVFHTNQTTIDDFRTHVINCTSSEDIHLIVTYNRKAFKQVCIMSLNLL